MTLSTTLSALDTDECMRLLAQHPTRLGRLAFMGQSGPVVLPVNYVVHKGSVVFRTDPGSKMLAVATGERLAFQVDDVDEGWMEGWSVLIQGIGREVFDSEEIEAINAKGLLPWAGSIAHTIEVLPTSITGRRLT